MTEDLIINPISDNVESISHDEYIGHLAAIVESSEDAIISKSLDGIIRSWNKGSEKMFGYTAKEAVGRHISFLIPFQHIPEEKMIIEKISNNEIIDHYETVRLKKNGEQFYVSLTVSPLKDRKGNIVGVSKIARDITLRKKVERELDNAKIELAFQKELITASNELKKTTEALGESNELFSKLFNYNPIAIVIAHAIDGRLININDAFLKLFGFSNKEEVIGKSTAELNLVSIEQRALVRQSLEYEIVKHFEIEAQTKNGAKLCVTTSVLKLNLKGSPCIISTIIDKTERKKTEEHLAERTLQLEASNKELESFSYSVSHDLRAPLRAIHGYTKMLKVNFETQLNPEAHRLMSNIMRNAKKMAQLIDELLNFSRIGRNELEKINVPMNDMVTKLCNELKNEQPDRTIEFHIKQLLPAQADYTAIKQVWLNLISNAVKYSKHKDKSIIEIGSEIKGDEIVYHIKDNGAGFDMRYVDKLFGVFQRLHSNEEFEGTGVGLALVQRIITKHGGRVWAEGRVNEGATFYFTLHKS